MVFFLFIIGLCVGSCINVLVDRIPRGESVLFGRSHCDYCGQQLRWYDLLPVISYVLIQGKCRYCKKNLSLQYPLIEIATGLLFITLFLLESPIFLSQYMLLSVDLVLGALCFALFLMDIKYRILSDKLLIVFAFFALSRFFLTNPASIFLHIGIGFLAMLPLLLIFLFSKGRAMGFGDVKLIFLIGFLIGFPNIIICYYAAFLTGAVIGVILIIGEKRKFHGATIAFGPFLLLGMVVAVLWGNILWNFTKILIGL